MSTNLDITRKSKRFKIKPYADLNCDPDAQVIKLVLEGLNQKDKHIAHATKTFLETHQQEPPFGSGEAVCQLCISGAFTRIRHEAEYE